MMLFPNCWETSASGHVDVGETDEQAILRELEEEIGVKDVPLQQYHTSYREEDYQGKKLRMFDTFFMGTYDGTITPNSDEVSEGKWFTIEKIRQMIAEEIQQFTPGFLKALDFYCPEKDISKGKSIAKGKIAIDIVLLPPEEVMDLVLQVNRKAVQQGTASIELSKDTRIPHISLLMGVLDTKNLPKVKKIIQHIAKTAAPLTLTADKALSRRYSIAQNYSLQQLHEQFVQQADLLLTHTATKEMFLEEKYYLFPDNFDHWVNTFIKEHSLENYHPHLSFHAAESDVPLPFTFKASTLALCHLGAHNTCRKILFKTTLKS